MATFNAANTGDWRTAGSWAEGSGYPVAGDTVIFGAGFTGTITISQAEACAVLNLTGNGGTLAFGAQSLTITANISLGGTITATTGGIIMTGVDTSRIITSNGVTFPGLLTSTNAKTVTLKGNLILGKGLVISASSATVINKTDVGDGDTLTINDATASVLTLGTALSGTTNIVIAGTGCVWSGSNNLSNNLTFNCTSATISGRVKYIAGTLTYTAGTITTTSSTLDITGACTLDTDRGATKITLNNLTISLGTYTITLSSNLTGTGMLKAGGGNSPTFSGAFDISFYEFSLASSVSSGATVFTFPAGRTFTITNSLAITSIQAAIPETLLCTLKSSSTSNPFYLNYTGTLANCKVFGTTFTDVDASGSSIPIYNWYGGTLTRTTNIINVTASNIGGIFIQ